MLAIELTETVKNKILEAHLFWFTKRLLFNILVGISGVIGLAINWYKLFCGIYQLLFIVLGSIVWGLVANAFYSLGFELDCLIIHITKGLKSLDNNRILVFWTGTILYMLVSVLFAFSMSMP
jgi:hypothetical protein